MAGLYCNFVVKILFILKMQLIGSLLKSVSLEIICHLAALLLRKTRRQSYIVILFFLAVKKSGKKIALTI